jgi:ribosomal protein S18 acetylase RimI-like enzyme
VSLELAWLSTPTEDDRAGLFVLVTEVAALGGAVGWLYVPERREVDAWLDGVLAQVTAGTARFCIARDAGRVVGCGYWHRHPGPVLGRNAELSKLMTSPSARGRGVGRAVTSAVVADARAAGVEVLTLECRGNNHGALRLYARSGFVTTGRRPDFLAVNDERFDQVLLHLDLRDGPGTLRRHGGLCEGPGRT